jgi:conjugative relaxase-like TrwC/TraI family protein
MLGMRRIGADRADYYLADLARELPLASAGGARWLGQAAQGLGLRGPVDPDRFRAVLAGRHPETNRTMGSGRGTVHGVDLTFSAPKSVSVLFGLGEDEVARHVVAGHVEAVQGAVAYLEAHAVSACRRAGEEREVIPTTGMVAGLFTHGVNRNLDPHLHSHVVMANLVHGEDGRWSASDQRGLAAHRMAAGAVYDAHLRMELTARLRVTWTQAPLRAAEVQGVSPSVMGELSSRSAEIRQHAATWGTHSARGTRLAWAVTRAAKPPSVGIDTLRASWERRARGAGLEQWERPGRSTPRTSLSEHQFASVLSTTADGGVRRRDVVTAFAAAAPDGVAAPALAQLTSLWVPDRPGVVGVTETMHQRREMLPRPFELDTLGPRPIDPTEHAVWCTAARDMARYRQRWGVTQPRQAWDVDPAAVSGFSTERLIDHLRTTQHVDAARTRLGHRSPPVLELGRSR